VLLPSPSCRGRNSLQGARPEQRGEKSEDGRSFPPLPPISIGDGRKSFPFPLLRWGRGRRRGEISLLLIFALFHKVRQGKEGKKRNLPLFFPLRPPPSSAERERNPYSPLQKRRKKSSPSFAQIAFRGEGKENSLFSLPSPFSSRTARRSLGRKEKGILFFLPFSSSSPSGEGEGRLIPSSLRCEEGSSILSHSPSRG